MNLCRLLNLVEWAKVLWGVLTLGRLVWLEDMDGQVTLAIARTTVSGKRVAKRWWPTNVHNVVLGEDGAVENGSYVKRWKYVRGA